MIGTAPTLARRPVLLAIAGDRAAGKTTLAKGLLETLGLRGEISRFNGPPLAPSRSLCALGGAELGDKELATEITRLNRSIFPIPDWKDHHDDHG